MTFSVGTPQRQNCNRYMVIVDKLLLAQELKTLHVSKAMRQFATQDLSRKDLRALFAPSAWLNCRLFVEVIPYPDIQNL
jgi:hypothetical protein